MKMAYANGESTVLPGTTPTGWTLEALAGDDSQAWDAFFKEFDPVILKVLRWKKWRFRPDVQEDVAQKIRTSLLSAMKSFQGKSTVTYYVRQVSVLRCIDQVRSQAREGAVFVPGTLVDEDGISEEEKMAADDSFDPVEEVMKTERGQRVKVCLGQLDETCRNAVTMFYVEDLSYREMAEKLGVAVPTVGSRLFKCLDKLKGIIRGDTLLREYFNPTSRLPA